MEGRLEEPLFCKKYLVSKIYYHEELLRVVGRDQERKGEVLRLYRSPTLLNICTYTF
jgi:hypothetical protein